MSDDEAQLVARAQAGDAEAFSRLVATHQGAVRAWLRRLAGDPDEADDLAQDVFLKAWERLPGYVGRGSLKSWLFTMAYRDFVSRRRRQGREREVMALYASGQTEAVEGDEALLDLEPLLARLAEPERACILLTHAWGLTTAEAGDVLQMPAGTVKSHVHRARRKLDDYATMEA